METLPIFEHEYNKSAVIMPEHEKLDINLPEKAVFPFLGDEIDKYAVERGLKPIAIYKTITKDFPVYVDEYKGEKFALAQAPLGAPAAASFMDWLIGYGVKKVISAGSCGALVDIPENTFLIPVKALRDEGTSYHYIEPSRYAYTDEGLRKTIEKTFSEKGLKYEECMTWTTDGFFRETHALVAKRRAEGCVTAEMECAALCACATLRDVAFAQILYTADSLADLECYDARNWGEDSMRPALELCLEIIAKH